MSEHELKSEMEAQVRRIDAVFWAVVLIWAGLVFWLDSLGNLPAVGEGSVWSWIFLGAGAYGLLAALVRQISASLVVPKSKDYFWAGLFVIIGLAGLTSWNITWPLILILVGVAVLGGALLGRR